MKVNQSPHKGNTFLFRNKSKVERMNVYVTLCLYFIISQSSFKVSVNLNLTFTH